MSGKVVVDASVALKWLFEDETDLAAARELLARMRRQEVELVVPSHWPLEVLNGIKSAIVKKRLEPARAQALVNDFIDVGVATTESGLSIARRAEEVGLDKQYLVLYAMHSQVEHSDISGLSSLYESTSNGERISDKPTAAWVPQCLSMSTAFLVLIIEAWAKVANVGVGQDTDRLMRQLAACGRPSDAGDWPPPIHRKEP